MQLRTAHAYPVNLSNDSRLRLHLFCQPPPCHMPSHATKTTAILIGSCTLLQYVTNFTN